ncbi:hypothetical protein [Nostoc sp. CMAA1605]|uniref:hypothetical protein n=1 Tax=Nostoc sp. CMAA1605 TaxID=2055159 RepID=UPI001F458B4B|nr:hypothetical protein [Nostoc sp. CMAA1605]
MGIGDTSASSVHRWGLGGGQGRQGGIDCLNQHAAKRLASANSTHYLLLITHYPLLSTQHSALITYYSSLITHYSLLITQHSLLITHHSLA